MSTDVESKELCKLCGAAMGAEDLYCHACVDKAIGPRSDRVLAETHYHDGVVEHAIEFAEEPPDYWRFSRAARAHEREKIAAWLVDEGHPALAARVRLKQHIVDKKQRNLYRRTR